MAPEEEKGFKQEVKGWWNRNKGKIAVGVKCLAIGLAIGFIKGVTTTVSMNAQMMCEMADKIPDEDTKDDDDEVTVPASTGEQKSENQ